MPGVPVPKPEPPSADPVVARLDQMLAELAAVVADCTPVADADRIDRIARLEKLRAVTAAVQAAESVRFAQSQVAEQLAADVHPERIGRGIAEQIGLACRISPATAARWLGTARALWHELPDTYRQLITGELSERVAETVVAETRHLVPEIRRQVDAQVTASGISGMGFKAAAACIRKTAYEADRHGYVERGRTERKHRRVGCWPAPDTMAILSGCLPMEQGIACYAALRQHADATVAKVTAGRGIRSWPTPSLSRSRIALCIHRRRRPSQREEHLRSLLLRAAARDSRRSRLVSNESLARHEGEAMVASTLYRPIALIQQSRADCGW